MNTVKPQEPEAEMHIPPSQIRTNFKDQIGKLNGSECLVDPFGIGNVGTYLNIFIAGDTRKLGIGSSPKGIKSRHTNKFKDISTAGGKSSEAHHRLSDCLVNPNSPVTEWSWHTIPVSSLASNAQGSDSD